MRFAIVTLLAITSTATTVAIAQDGSGHGPPSHKTPIIVVPQIPAPISLPTGPVRKYFQPKSELVSATK